VSLTMPNNRERGYETMPRGELFWDDIF